MENHTVPGPRPKALDRALVDIEQGRLWMARDRLGSYLKGHPVHPAVRDLYGEVLYRMGDWPMAGRAWYLTDRDDEAARASISAFESKFQSPVMRALAVGRGLDAPELPTAAAARAALLKDQLPTGFAWPTGQRGMPIPPESKLGKAAGIFVFILVFALICVVLAGIGLGLIQIGRATIEWIGGLFGT